MELRRRKSAIAGVLLQRREPSAAEQWLPPRRHAPFWLDRRTRPVLLCLLTGLFWHVLLGHILLRTVVSIRPQIVVGHCIAPLVRTRLIIIGQRPTAVDVTVQGLITAGTLDNNLSDTASGKCVIRRAAITF
jgi:hypothetical protein